MNTQTPLHFLKTHFGYSSFRPLQEEIINHVISGGDCLVLMPTGGGKSVCFQIPAVMMEGTAIVVSPLISLMKDQVEGLRMNGIAAEALNSGNDELANRATIDRMMRGELKLLYVSPERLIADLEWFATLRISMIAIDEAHCISQWGHDFRPEYTQLGTLRERFPNVPIIALTATADKLTKTDIVEQLHLKNPQLFVSSFDRPNLSLEVKTGYRKRDKLQTILDMIKRHPNESGIIYCLARKTTEELVADLRRKGIAADAYHAGLPAEQRSRVQEDFTNDRTLIICATIAFGMGIDKSNVRFIVHYNLPKSIESFYQEIGRAGRDGLPSETMLFYNLQDIMTLQKFVDESGQREINQEKLNRMKEYAEAKVCRRRILLNYFGETSASGCQNCDVCHRPPRMFDGTVVVQKALSAILRAKEQIGFTLLLDILRGSLNSEIVTRKLNQIKTYGVGRDIPARDWQNYFLQMLQMGFIEIAYNEDRHLKVTELGREVLKGKTVQLAVAEHEDFRVKARRSQASEQAAALARRTSQGCRFPADFPAPEVRREDLPFPDSQETSKDIILFEALRQLRLQIAKEIDKPAYVIFSDKTLHVLAAQKPTTKAAFSEIYGIGQNKAEQFAEPFIEVIKRFAPSTELPFAEQEEIPQEKPSKPKKSKNCIQRNNKQYIIDEDIWESIEWRKILNDIQEKAYWNYSGETRLSLSDYVPLDIAKRDRIIEQLAEIACEVNHIGYDKTSETLILPQRFDYDQEGRVVQLPTGSFEEILTRFRMFVIKNQRFPFMDGSPAEISLRKWHREISHGLIPITEDQKMMFDLLATEFPDVPKHRAKG